MEAGGVYAPTVLCESAIVGQALLVALLDYCNIYGADEADPAAPPPPSGAGSAARNALYTSSVLQEYGGMRQLFSESKRYLREKPSRSSKKGVLAATQPAYKQY
ncbi:hypothetical protein STCU_10911 [Strigomonas culicis]|uniref:Uncharacterized protein n=1 Tax=Strigomonas culicis TaxID=28005 RepID=S9TFS3_9TRYP|nr:hypothetical protein STCU_10911 [Strigomonas culicis]|eukprot:EPY16922.1 hypothetical protein STCU_10911 [Strigomonas culicis]